MSSYIDIKYLNLLSTRLPKFKRKSDYGKIILESKNKKVWILTNGFIK